MFFLSSVACIVPYCSLKASYQEAFQLSFSLISLYLATKLYNVLNNKSCSGGQPGGKAGDCIVLGPLKSHMRFPTLSTRLLVLSYYTGHHLQTFLLLLFLIRSENCRLSYGPFIPLYFFYLFCPHVLSTSSPSLPLLTLSASTNPLLYFIFTCVLQPFF